MLIMPEIHVRGVSDELLKQINLASAEAEISQREWIIQRLTEATNEATNATTNGKGISLPSVEQTSRNMPRRVEAIVSEHDDRRDSPAVAQVRDRTVERATEPSQNSPASKSVARLGNKTCKHGFTTCGQCSFADGSWLGPKHSPRCPCSACKTDATARRA